MEKEKGFSDTPPEIFPSKKEPLSAFGEVTPETRIPDGSSESLRKELSPEAIGELNSLASFFMEPDVYRSYKTDPLSRAALRRSLTEQGLQPHEVRLIIDILGLGPSQPVRRSRRSV